MGRMCSDEGDHPASELLRSEPCLPHFLSTLLTITSFHMFYTPCLFWFVLCHQNGARIGREQDLCFRGYFPVTIDVSLSEMGRKSWYEKALEEKSSSAWQS